MGWFLIRRMRWGRQFWRLSGMYFIPRQRTWLSWRPILTVALLLLLTVVDVRLNVILSFQGNDLFTAMQELNAAAFWRSIFIFGILATINVVLVLVTFYIGQAQIIHWRLWLNQRMLGDWLNDSAYHRGRFVSAPVDNPDQRIQQDITSYVGDSQTLALGAVSSAVSLVSFTIILWQLSGPLAVFGLQIPRGMVFLAYIYVIIATVFAFRIGRPLIRLNFLNELLTASYRYALVRVRDNSESIAFYRGEQVENAGLLARFAAIIANTWAIVFRSLKFQGFNLVISQIAVVSRTSSRLSGSSASRSPSAMSRRPPTHSGRFREPCRSSGSPTTTSPATGRRSTGSRGCWTPTKRPAPCRSQQLRSEQLGWA